LTSILKESGVTLSFFSEVIKKNDLDMSHTQIRENLVASMADFLSTLGVKCHRETKGVKTILLIEMEQRETQLVKGWEVIFNFLSRNEVTSSEKPFLKDYRIILTLRPKYIEDKVILSKSTKEALKDSLSILDKLPEEFELTVSDKRLIFDRLVLDRSIEPNSWKVIVGGNRSATVGDVIQAATNIIKQVDASSRERNKPNKTDFYFLDNVSKEDHSAISGFLEYSGVNLVPERYSAQTFSLKVSSGQIGTNSAVIGTFPKDGTMTYFNWKKSTIADRIASQNVIGATSFPKIQTIKLELMHKLGYRPLELNPVEEAVPIDGVLYLSRVNEWLSWDDPDRQKYERLLGSVLVYGERPNETEEVALTIDDPISLDESESKDGFEEVVNNEENVATALSNGMSLSNRTLDLIFTQRVGNNKIYRLVSELGKRNIHIRKAFYFSTKYSCSPSDPERTEGGNNASVNYRIVQDKHLFFQPSQRVLGFFDIGTAYCELLYPLDTNIEEMDAISIVRLAKRRLYRVYNVPSLRVPEPIIIFREKKKMIAELSGSGRVIPLRLLI
jgi:hypothetical protein